MTTADAYREGLAYGRRMADHDDGRHDHERSLRFTLSLNHAPSRRLRRARALGELRGYRQAQP